MKACILASCVLVFGINFYSFSSLAASIEAAQVHTYDGQVLNGFWTLPDAAPVGAVVILQGSGNVGADGDVSAPLLGSGYHGQVAHLSEQMADALAAVGIASIRYAKRGFDDSTQLPNQTVPFIKKMLSLRYRWSKRDFLLLKLEF